MGDEIELGAVERLLGDAAGKHIAMSSTKSAIGHLLGAAGAVEAIFSVLAMRDQIVPPTINLDNPRRHHRHRPGAAHRQAERKIDVALSNSFGFGGTNAPANKAPSAPASFSSRPAPRSGKSCSSCASAPRCSTRSPFRRA
jgi:3-oxoacyl-[acyl-carrier-protein] synthase II